MCKISEGGCAVMVHIFLLYSQPNTSSYSWYTPPAALYSLGQITSASAVPSFVVRLRQTFFQHHLQGQKTPQFLSAIILTSRSFDDEQPAEPAGIHFANTFKASFSGRRNFLRTRFD